MADIVKIQLNSEEAIRSIIAGDPALELEIKNKITCAIADGYEKINREAAMRSVEAISTQVSEQVFEELTESRKDGWKTVTYLKPEVRELIVKQVDFSVKSTVSDLLSETREAMLKTVSERIDSISQEIVKRTTNEAFENAVRNEVIRRYDAIQKAIEAENNKD